MLRHYIRVRAGLTTEQATSADLLFCMPCPGMLLCSVRFFMAASLLPLRFRVSERVLRVSERVPCKHCPEMTTPMLLLKAPCFTPAVCVPAGSCVHVHT
jgi:hypothetical protein